MESPPVRKLRADARRSREQILAAARRLLPVHPDVSMEMIAAEAGVTRQTVYAHFPTRGDLLSVVLDRVSEEITSEIDRVELEVGSATNALLRLVGVIVETSARYGPILRAIGPLPESPEADQVRHAPVAERLERLVQRGQRTGEFDDTLPSRWLVAVIIAVAHAAHEQVEVGSMPRKSMESVLRTTLDRLLRADAPGRTD